MSLLLCLSLLPVLGWTENGFRPIPKTGEKPLKIPLNSSKSKSHDGFYPIDGEDEEEEQSVPKKRAGSSQDQDFADSVSSLEPSLEDFPGETVAGIPRLIRASPETEVFFRDLNTSYIIPQTDKHNRFFNAFDQASKRNQQVSFRVDPVSRRVLAMDGVDGVRAPAKAQGKVLSGAASTGGPGGGSSGTAGSR